MNREIKFRIWDGDKFYFVENILEFGYINQLLKIGRFDVRKEYIVHQFTGLEDKNNKEIYEGDILEIPEKEIGKGSIHEKYCHVWYSDFSGSWVVSYNHLYSEVSHDLYHHIYDYQIIGNILENPNLLV